MGRPALSSLFLVSLSVRPLGPPPHLCEHTPSPLAQQMHLDSTGHPAFPPLPSSAPIPRPFKKHEALPHLQLAPRKSCFPARNVLSTEPAHTAPLLRSSLQSAPPFSVFSQREFIPCALRFPARLLRARHRGRKAQCAQHQGVFHLLAGLSLS